MYRSGERSRLLQSSCRQKPLKRPPRRLLKLKRQYHKEENVDGNQVRKVQSAARNLMQSTFTRFWSRCIPTQEYHRRPWVSWTHLSMIYVNALLLRPLLWHTTTNDLPSRRGKFRLQSTSCFQGNWLSMPYQRVQRQLQSTTPPK